MEPGMGGPVTVLNSIQIAEPDAVILSSFLKVARQRYYWSSPARLLRIVGSIAGNLPRQLEVFRILSLPAFRSLVEDDPVFPFKYLSTRYMFRGLPAGHRGISFVHHFRYLEAHLPPSVLHKRQPLQLTVFERREGDNLYSIRLDCAPSESRFEGELRLGLLMDGVLIYCLQFSIVPGWIVQSTEKDSAFVLRVQGLKGQYERVRCATKALQEVAPPALLMAALQGLASAWGIRHMAGVSATKQYCFAPAAANLFTQTYDDFFTALGATRTTVDYFSSPLPLPAKSLDLIRNGHKSRTVKKRAFKLQIAREVCQWAIGNTQAAVAAVPLLEMAVPTEEDSVAS